MVGPIPSVSDSTATMVKPGALARCRSADRTIPTGRPPRAPAEAALAESDGSAARPVAAAIGSAAVFGYSPRMHLDWSDLRGAVAAGCLLISSVPAAAQVAAPPQQGAPAARAAAPVGRRGRGAVRSLRDPRDGRRAARHRADPAHGVVPEPVEAAPHGVGDAGAARSGRGRVPRRLDHAGLGRRPRRGVPRRQGRQPRHQRRHHARRPHPPEGGRPRPEPARRRAPDRDQRSRGEGDAGDDRQRLPAAHRRAEGAQPEDADRRLPGDAELGDDAAAGRRDQEDQRAAAGVDQGRSAGDPARHVDAVRRRRRASRSRTSSPTCCTRTTTATSSGPRRCGRSSRRSASSRPSPTTSRPSPASRACSTARTSPAGASGRRREADKESAKRWQASDPERGGVAVRRPKPTCVRRQDVEPRRPLPGHERPARRHHAARGRDASSRSGRSASSRRTSSCKLEFRATPNADSGVFLRGPQLQCRDYPLAGPYTNLTKYKPQDWNEMIVTVQNGVGARHLQRRGARRRAEGAADRPDRPRRRSRPDGVPPHPDQDGEVVSGSDSGGYRANWLRIQAVVVPEPSAASGEQQVPEPAQLAQVARQLG